ncbi:helix-turn-helix domain-containing protein, partial [Streptomyces sp. CBMA156]
MGSAWKQLPEELSEPARRLAQELRAIKDAAGLSLSELAARTHYSRASWERWLNGKRIVTEQALDALVGAVDCDGAALRALWRQAVAGPEAVAGAEAGPAVTAEAPAEAVADGPSGSEEPTTEKPAADEALVTGQEPGPAPAGWWRRPAALV